MDEIGGDLAVHHNTSRMAMAFLFSPLRSLKRFPFVQGGRGVLFLICFFPCVVGVARWGT